MKFSTASMTKKVEFLACDEYVCVPMKATANKSAGAVATYDGITGLVLYDIVIANNPNGALLVEGIVDQAKLPAVPTSEQKAAMPRITFRTNIGVNS